MTQKPDTLPTAAPARSGARTRRQEPKAPLRLRIYRVLRKILIGFILVSIANVIFSQFFFTPKMYRIDRENRELMIRYRILQDRIRTAQNCADEIRDRDSHV